MIRRFSAVSLIVLAGFAAQPSFAQMSDVDPEIRVQQLENQLRQLTGQNEELQHRNRMLEEQLRALQPQGPAAGQAPAQAPVAVAPPRPNIAAAPAGDSYPPRGEPYGAPANNAPPPIVQDQTVPPPSSGRRRGDAFDPSQNPNAPGAPRPLGGGGQPMPVDPSAQAGAPVGAPGGREAGEPLDINRRRQDQAGLTTLPPSATPRDEFDLGLGYMQRRDYALAEETMRNFVQRYPQNPQVSDAQYWLGESFYQRQRYRDAAEAFLAVTTKYDTSGKAPDALLRLGQSLAALKEKEAACAAFGEVTRKYPRASNGVKQAVDREQKKVKC